jgi:ribonuclease BN (tRNA processing enzyme)
MKLTFLGCGDAFGSGGRFNTCFHVEGATTSFLIDCGSSSMIPLKARHIDANAIRTILITHFHADHCGGVPFFMLNAQLISRRKQPLTIAGPRGLLDWFERAMEISFPGSSRVSPNFELSLVELGPYETTDFGAFQVTSFLADHGAPGGLAYAYRILVEGRTIAYTGDSAWTDTLIEAGREADLFIAEAYFHDKKVRHHLDLSTLMAYYHIIKPKQFVLTHMSDDMLGRLLYIPFTTAEDGKVIEL